MKKFLISMVAAIWCSILGYAYQFTFDGEADGKYPILMEVDRNENGAIYGRYAYKVTLKRQGREKSSSWLYIRPDGNSNSSYIITDSKGDIQEYWTYASFWRKGDVNYFHVCVKNAKGKEFSLDALSTSKNITTWAGKYDIECQGYRMCPPPISVRLTLTQKGNNTYTGIWYMRDAEDYSNEHGRFFGVVSGVVSNGVMTVTMTSCDIVEGNDRPLFDSGDSYPKIPNNSIIATIKKNGQTFKIQPEGKMKSYLTDILSLTIVKTK